jgi:hypothetical protein
MATLAAASLMSVGVKADTWTKCSVDLVDVTPDDTFQPYVYLSDAAGNPQFTRRFFRVMGTNVRDAFTVFLAAASSNKRVYVLSDVDVVGPDDVATISIVYLVTVG